MADVTETERPKVITTSTPIVTNGVPGTHVVSVCGDAPVPPLVTAATLETLASGEPAARCVLEDFTRCSESHLWKLMMSFYDRKGVESWSQGIVPHFITSNAFIGRAYAQVSAPGQGASPRAGGS
jgi:hypothetical protein